MGHPIFLLDPTQWPIGLFSVVYHRLSNHGPYLLAAPLIQTDIDSIIWSNWYAYIINIDHQPLNDLVSKAISFQISNKGLPFRTHLGTLNTKTLLWNAAPLVDHRCALLRRHTGAKRRSIALGGSARFCASPLWVATTTPKDFIFLES